MQRSVMIACGALIVGWGAVAYAQVAVEPTPVERVILIDDPREQAVQEVLAVEEAIDQADEQGTATSHAEDETAKGAFYGVAKLQGLNKVTARISDIEAPLDVQVWFGTLQIVVEQCWQAPPESLPENAALLNIREHKPDEEPVSVFHGWMFSSSPSLSGVEHPVYDVTVLECLQKSLGEVTIEERPAVEDTAQEQAIPAE